MQANAALLLSSKPRKKAPRQGQRVKVVTMSHATFAALRRRADPIASRTDSATPMRVPDAAPVRAPRTGVP